MNPIRSLSAALFSLAVFGATSAAALCTAPQLGNPNDLIIQMNAASSGQTFIGAGNAIGVNSTTARSLGAIYFDSTAGSLVTCDGTDWITVGGAGGDSGGTSCEAQNDKTYNPDNPPTANSGQTYNNTANIPAADLNYGMLDFGFSGTNDNYYEYEGSRRDCNVEIETTSGWVYAGTANKLRTGNARDGINYTSYNVSGSMRLERNADGTHTITSASGSPGQRGDKLDRFRTENFNGKKLTLTGRIRAVPGGG